MREIIKKASNALILNRGKPKLEWCDIYIGEVSVTLHCMFWDRVNTKNNNKPLYEVLLSSHISVEEALKRVDEVAKMYPSEEDITVKIMTWDEFWEEKLKKIKG
jgi:hypothetical protein